MLIKKLAQKNKTVAAIFDLGFLLAFLTLNISLIPGLSGEYQPIIFLIISLCAVFLVENAGKSLWLIFLGIIFSLVLSTLIGYAAETQSANATVRCLIGPVFILCSYPLLSLISVRVLKLVIWVHLVFAGFGLVIPNVVINVIGALGLRGVNYYDGWNAFFSSEPSYAAINLAAIIAIMMIKTADVSKVMDSKNHDSIRFYTLAAAVIMLLTKSVTGVFFAFLLFWVLFKRGGNGNAKANAMARLLVILVCVGVCLAYWFGKDEKNRVTRFLDVLFSDSLDGSLFNVLSTEQSGAWRLIANIAGFSTVVKYPFGLADVSLYGRINELLPTYFADLAEKSNVYLSASGEIYPQTVVASYAMYGGVPALLILSLIVLYSTYSAVLRFDAGSKVYLVFYILIGVLWQSALTAPGWWLVIGYLFASKNRSNQFDKC